MIAGRLTNIIFILRPQKVISEYGQEKTEYVHKFKTRARVESIFSREQDSYEIGYSDVRNITVYYYVPVDDFDLIVLNGVRYKVLSIEPNREYNEKRIRMERVED